MQRGSRVSSWARNVFRFAAFARRGVAILFVRLLKATLLLVQRVRAQILKSTFVRKRDLGGWSDLEVQAFLALAASRNEILFEWIHERLMQNGNDLIAALRICNQICGNTSMIVMSDRFCHENIS
jgi:hypothetical protein